MFGVPDNHWLLALLRATWAAPLLSPESTPISTYLACTSVPITSVHYYCLAL
jgi:hypothetical protein